MTTYLIVYGRDLNDRFAAYRFDTRAEAFRPHPELMPSVPVNGFGQLKEEAEERLGVGGCHILVETEEDAARGMSGPTQVAVFNRLTGGSVKKFENRSVGAKRVLTALAERAITPPAKETKVYEQNHTPLPNAAPATEEKIMTDTPTNAAEVATDAIATESATPPAASASGRGPRADARVISVKIDKNPKREGTAAFNRFELYRDGMTVDQFIAAGGSRIDVSYDVKKGYIELGAAT